MQSVVNVLHYIYYQVLKTVIQFVVHPLPFAVPSSQFTTNCQRSLSSLSQLEVVAYEGLELDL